MNSNLKRIYKQFISGVWSDGRLVYNWLPMNELCIDFWNEDFHCRDKIKLK